MRGFVERETGIEPAAYSLATSRSTTELFPQKCGAICQPSRWLRLVHRSSLLERRWKRANPNMGLSDMQLPVLTKTFNRYNFTKDWFKRVDARLYPFSPFG